MRVQVVAFLSGVVFAIGLSVAGMTQPSKVTGFLDFTGSWDPSLAFVMMGAIGVHFLFARRVASMKSPYFSGAFALPTPRSLDAPLLCGAAIFGVSSSRPAPPRRAA